MKVLVTGVTGQLGYDVCRELEKAGITYSGVGSRDCDITDMAAVSAVFDYVKPDAVIHCAAYTKVDAAEDDPERCMSVNFEGTRNIAACCREIGAKLLYISTDYVFPGTGEQYYKPDDPTGPQNVYGKSKLAGEQAVQALLEHYFIVRISWVFGINGSNFLKTMLRLAETRSEIGVVCDQIGSPTYTADLAPLLVLMIQTEKYGLYHATNEGVCSWAELAEEVFRQAGKMVHVKYLSTAEYVSRARRPCNSRLSKDKLDVVGLPRLPMWQNAVERYLGEIGHE